MNRLELRAGATDIPFHIPGGVSELGANRGTTLTNSERGTVFCTIELERERD